jgi:DNA replication protein DnaC
MITNLLTDKLKKLRLTGILESYDVRLTQARENALSHNEWLELILQDEIQRREANALESRIKQARFDGNKTFESFTMTHYPSNVEHLIRDLMTGQYLMDKKHIAIVGPTGTGKTHLAQSLGHNACRQGKTVRFTRAAQFLREMKASRADKTWDKILKRFTSPDLLILDDFGLSTLSFEEAEDMYELIVARDQKSSIVFTSNRKIEVFAKLFPDEAMGHAATDRILGQSYQLILDGESYRQKRMHNHTQGQG